MCRVLEVSRSGFYAWQTRPPSARARATQRLDVRIRVLYQASKRRAGSHKITQALRQTGWRVTRKRVARRMQVLGLRSITQRQFHPTTDSRHAYPVAPNRLQRRFQVPAPNQVWVTDITYLWTQRGWVYLTVFLDLFSRMVVGWAVSPSLRHPMVVAAFEQAMGRRRPPRGLLVHSDRGSQYACQAFTNRLAAHGCVQSMSRKGNCWDNAVAESFFRTLKTELTHHCNLQDVAHAQRALFTYIERDYNRHRLHATLGYRSPMDFEQLNMPKCA